MEHIQVEVISLGQVELGSGQRVVPSGSSTFAGGYTWNLPPPPPSMPPSSPPMPPQQAPSIAAIQQSMPPPPPPMPPRLEPCLLAKSPCSSPTSKVPSGPPLHFAESFSVALDAPECQEVQVKNTFLTIGLPRESIPRRLAQSCPGSRLPSPKGSRLPTPSNQRKGEIAQKFEEQSNLGDEPLDRISLQAAAWGSLKRQQQDEAIKGALAAHMLAAAADDSSEEEYTGEVQVQMQAAAMPVLGSPDLPSVGSLGHHMRRCKPCAFIARQGCSNGVQCGFCHLCEPGEKKRRRKEKRGLISAARRLVAANEAKIAGVLC